MLLRFRGRVLTSDHDSAQRLETLVSGTSQVLVLFRAILRLRDEVPPADNEELCRKTAAIAGFDPAPFIAVLGHWRGGKALGRVDAGCGAGRLPRGAGTGCGLSGRAPGRRLNPAAGQIRCRESHGGNRSER